MHYVRLKTPPTTHQARPHTTRMPWGQGAAGHVHDIGVHPETTDFHHTMNVPGFMAEDLVAQGCEVVEISVVEDGRHVSVGHTDVSQLDLRDEIATAPRNVLEVYLTLHNALTPQEKRGQINVRQLVEDPSIKDPDERKRRAKIMTAPIINPGRPTDDDLRKRALSIHDAKGKKR